MTALLAAPKPVGSVVAIDSNTGRLEDRFRTPTLDAEATIEQLRTSLDEVTTKFENLQKTLEGLQQRQVDIVALNKGLLEQKDTLEKASAEKAAHIKSLEDAQSGLTRQVAESSKIAEESAQLQEQLKTQQAQLDAAKKHAALLEAATAATAAQDTAENTTFSRQVQELTAERDTLRSQAKSQESQTQELEKLRLALTEAQAHTATATSTDTATTDQIVSLTEQIETLNREKADAEAKQKDLEAKLEERDSTDERYAALAQQYDELKASLDEVSTASTQRASVLDTQRLNLAQDQWTALFASIINQLSSPLETFSQACASIPILKKQIANQITLTEEAAAGRRIALGMNKDLRSENENLKKQLAQLAEFDARVKALETQKAALEDAAKQHTTEAKEKNDNIVALTAQLQELQAQLAASAAAMEELQSSQIAPAAQLRAQLVALKQLMGTFVGQIQRQLAAIGEKTTPLAEYIEAAKENEQKLRDLSRSLKTLEDNVRELIDLAKQVSTLKRSPKSSDDSSSADTGEVRRLQDQIASLTAQYNQLTKDANDRVDMLQAQLQSRDGSSVKDEVASLRQQLDAERERRETDARIAQQVREASLAARVDQQDRGSWQAQIDSQRDRQTDSYASTTQAMAGQAFAAGIAASSKTAAPSSSPVVVTLSGLQSDLARYGAAPTQQVINGMPTQYQPYMSSMAGLPQFGVPTSMGQLTTTTGILSQNRRTYIDTYHRVINFLRSPASRANPQAFNSLEATVFNAVSREAYLWFTRGLNAANASVRAEAVNNLRMLMDEVAKPLSALKADLERQGVKDYRQPEDLVAKISGFRRQLGDAI